MHFLIFSTRRYLSILIGCLGFALFASVAIAQQPTITARAQWDPNPAGDAVTSYSLSVDGGAPITVPASVCTATLCEQSVTVPLGSHTFSVAAVNQWGASSVTAVTVTIAPPIAPKNLRIVK